MQNSHLATVPSTRSHCKILLASLETVFFFFLLPRPSLLLSAQPTYLHKFLVFGPLHYDISSIYRTVAAVFAKALFKCGKDQAVIDTSH